MAGVECHPSVLSRAGPFDNSVRNQAQVAQELRQFKTMRFDEPVVLPPCGTVLAGSSLADVFAHSSRTVADKVR